jgi:hypothetical protein
MSKYPNVAVRPHTKVMVMLADSSMQTWLDVCCATQAHKCPEIAKLQLKMLGTDGVCCQKVRPWPQHRQRRNAAVVRSAPSTQNLHAGCIVHPGRALWQPAHTRKNCNDSRGMPDKRCPPH